MNGLEKIMINTDCYYQMLNIRDSYSNPHPFHKVIHTKVTQEANKLVYLSIKPHYLPLVWVPVRKYIRE